MTSSNNDQQSETKKPLSFSIEHILNSAGSQSQNVAKEETPENLYSACAVLSLPWLQCTRYCPPKIPRRKEAPQKRQLGRHPRIPFTTHQLSVLEEHFKQSPYLSSQEVKQVSKKLDLADIRVKIWFQNRRARERRERLVKNPEDCKTDDPRTPQVKYGKTQKNANSEEFLSIASTSSGPYNNIVSPSRRGYDFISNINMSSSPWSV